MFHQNQQLFMHHNKFMTLFFHSVFDVDSWINSSFGAVVWLVVCIGCGVFDWSRQWTSYVCIVFGPVDCACHAAGQSMRQCGFCTKGGGEVRVILSLNCAVVLNVPRRIIFWPPFPPSPCGTFIEKWWLSRLYGVLAQHLENCHRISLHAQVQEWSFLLIQQQLLLPVRKTRNIVNLNNFSSSHPPPSPGRNVASWLSLNSCANTDSLAFCCVLRYVERVRNFLIFRFRIRYSI